MSTTKVVLLAAAAILYVTPASAQKSQGTLRLAINNPYNILSTYDLSVDEAAVFSRDIHQKAFDRINEMHHSLPISSVPNVYLHTKDLRINPGKLSAGDNFVGDYSWN